MSGKPKQVNAWPGAASLREAVPEGWYTRKQAADLVGRDRDTIKEWQKNGTYPPSGYMEAGKIIVWLYSEEDIEAMRKIALHKRPGRKKKDNNNIQEEEGHHERGGTATV